MRHSRAPFRVSRLIVLLLASAAIGSSVGCESAPAGPPGEAQRSGKGLLVLHIRTDTPLKSITIGGWKRVALDTKSGTLLRVIEVPPGRYRWSRLELPELIDPKRYGWPAPPMEMEFRFPFDDTLAFRVEGGRINYVGLVDVYRADKLRINIRSIDRSALALEQLRREFPDLVAKYPVVYSGSGRNVFFERYRAAKRAPEATQGQGAQ